MPKTKHKKTVPPVNLTKSAPPRTNLNATATAVNASTMSIMPDTETLKRYQHLLIISMILLLAIIIYSNSIQNGFIQFDDPEIIYNNPTIRQITWPNLVQYFSTAPEFTFSPLVFISFAIDYQIGKSDPSTYHLTSLLLHLFCIVLVYWLFLVLTGRWSISAFITILFAIHPVNVDGISWLSTRSNVLHTFFYLGSLLAYTYYIKTNFKLRYLWGSLFLFICAVLSKSPAVVLALVLFLWDYYYGRRWSIQRGRKWNWRLIIEKIPFFLVAIIIGIITFHFHVDIENPFNYNFLDRVFVFCASITAYFYKLLFPFNLAFAYAYPAKDGDFLPYYYYLTPLILGLVVWGISRLKLSKKVMLFGLGFFLINIYLSQSVLFIDNFQANRYAYLPYLGLYFILADFHGQILNFTQGWKSKIKNIWKAVLVIFLIVFLILTYSRNSLWKNTITLFDDSIKKQPNITFTYIARGIARYDANDNQGALADFNHAAELDPNSYLANYNRGRVKSRSNDYQGALNDFSKALELKTDYPECYYERGFLKYNFQDYSGAITDYTTAISYYPQYSSAYNNRGIAKHFLKDFQGAIADYSQAIQLDPNFAEAYYNRGLAKQSLHDQSGATTDWGKAAELGYQPAKELIR